jgi:hypothetical protein
MAALQLIKKKNIIPIKNDYKFQTIIANKKDNNQNNLL